jgi:hypothetical protein
LVLAFKRDDKAETHSAERDGNANLNALTRTNRDAGA